MMRGLNGNRNEHFPQIYALEGFSTGNQSFSLFFLHSLAIHAIIRTKISRKQWAEILREGEGAMKQVTIKDIARAAGVSYSTVSRSLSGSSEISEKTRSRILQLCKEMNYTANVVARSMVMKSTKLLGLIVTDISNQAPSSWA